MTGDERTEAHEFPTVTTVTELIDREHGSSDLNARSGSGATDVVPHPRPQHFATGFTQLDEVLGGGFRHQELVLVRGRTGIGKTLAALQWARTFAGNGHTVLYVCRRHSPRSLLGRLIGLELGSRAREDELPTLRQLRRTARDLGPGHSGLPELIREPLGEEAVGRLRSCGDRLQIVCAPDRVDVATLRELAASRGPEPVVIVLDTLRDASGTTPGGTPPGTRAAPAVAAPSALAALKDLATSGDFVVIALAKTAHPNAENAVNSSPALAASCDVALTFRMGAGLPKIDVYDDGVHAFVGSVVVDVDLNRRTRASARVEFAKDLHRGRFHTEGRIITRP